MNRELNKEINKEIKNENEEKDLFWPLMITVILGTFAVMLSSSTINVVLPYLMEHFQTDLDHVKWTMTGFMLAMGVTAPITAFLGEKFSYKRVYIIAIVGFTVVSLFALFANNILTLVIIRILQGCFGGVTVPATMAMIYQIIPRKKQVLAISLWNIAPSLAPAIGPTISGILVQYFSWKAIFTINGLLGLITIILAIQFLPSYKLSSHISFDGIGFFFSILTGATLLTAFSEGAMWGWTSIRIIVLLAIGVITMIVFIIRELHTKQPALDLRIFKYKKFTAGLNVAIIINVAIYAGTLLTPIFLQQVQHLSPLKTGFIMLPATLVMAILMPVVGKLLNKFGAFPLVSIGILLVAIGTYKLTFLEVETTSIYLIGWMAVRYIGVSFSTMPINYLTIAVLPKEVSGHASSILNWMKQMFSCLSVGVFSSILTIRTNYHMMNNTSLAQEVKKSISSVQGINDVYMISCIVALIAIPFIFILFGRKGNEIKGNETSIKNNG